MAHTREELSKLVPMEGQYLSVVKHPVALPSLDDHVRQRFENTMQEESLADLSSQNPGKTKKKEEEPEAALPCLFDLQREISSRGFTQCSCTSAGPSNIEAIIEQISTAIQVLEQPSLGSSMVRLTLHHLGFLDGVMMDIKLQPEGLSVVFWAEEALAYDFLKKQLPQLQKTLEDQDIGNKQPLHLACYPVKPDSEQ